MTNIQPSLFEPLLPQSGLDALRERSRAVIEHSLRLGAAAHPDTIESLRELVREMSSYYSNRIEGQSTHPREIARAIRRDFSHEPTIARLQRIAVAHIDAERALESMSHGEPRPLSGAFVQRAHHELYDRLAEDDRTDAEGRVVEPGRFRTERVVVGRHEPPPPESLTAFVRRFDEVYGRPTRMEDELLVVAAAHHRMAWIHPFLDGNGRACRLQTHAALFPLTHGLWSVNRGLARRRDEYYVRLDDADSPRAGDLDGRGALSERALLRFCEWFVGVCEDQATFMTRLLDLDGMKTRIEALVTFRAAHDKRIRIEAALPLHHLFATGPVARGEFQRMTGLGERVARSLLAALLDTGLVTSSSRLGPVRFAFPLDALQFLLPELYPEAAMRE